MRAVNTNFDFMQSKHPLPTIQPPDRTQYDQSRNTEFEAESLAPGVATRTGARTEISSRLPCSTRSNSVVFGSGSVDENVPLNPDDFDIDTTIPSLGKWDVASLIINKTVGAGIFTTPPLVLMYTQNKVGAILLWLLGVLYSGLSMILYLSYAKAIPYTGGELIYLDAVFPRPRLFAYTIYATTFIVLMNSSTNCMHFGKQVRIASYGSMDNSSDEQALVRLFGIVVLSVLCLGIYLSNTLFRRMNLSFVLLKTAGMVVLIGAGLKKGIQSPGPISFGGIDHPSGHHAQYGLALLHVLFAFSGWENATFIRSEIENESALRWGFAIAWLTVGVGYLAINATFLIAIGNPTTLQLNSIIYAEWLFGGGRTARVAWAIATAISTAGSVAAMAYTSSKVNQSIAVAGVLPWSRLWMKEKQRSSPTSAGGLLLHWIWGVIFIAGTSLFRNLDQAISFQGFLNSYVQQAFGVLLTIGYLWLPKTMKDREYTREQQLEAIQPPSSIRENDIQEHPVTEFVGIMDPQPSSDSNQDTDEAIRSSYLSPLLRGLIVLVVLVCNIVFLVLPLATSVRQSPRPETQTYVYPISMVVLNIVGFIYYSLCFASPNRSIIRLCADLNVEIRPLCHGAPHKKFGFMYRVYLTPATDFPGTIQKLVRWLFGWTITSQRDRIDPIHGPKAIGCKCLPPSGDTEMQRAYGLTDPSQRRRSIASSSVTNYRH